MTAHPRLRVVVATRLFTPEVGAAAFRLQALVDGLVAAGADVSVVTTRAPGGATAGNVPFRISRWPVLRDGGGNVRGYVQYLSFDVPAFVRLLLQRADVVVSEPPPTTGLMVALSSWLRRRPFVYYAADVWSEALSATDVPGFVVRLMRRVEGFVLRRAACVIAISDAVAEQVAKFDVPAERVRVVANGVDTSVFNPHGDAAHSDRPYFAYTGTISEWQGADVFIRALPLVQRKFPTAEIRFFGQGTDEPALRALADEVAPGSVVFGGVVPPREAAAWLRGAVAALVSIKPGQGYDFAKPTKIYAAAGCGARVIFAGPGEGAAVVANNGLGDAVDHDPDAVAAAMIAALEKEDTGHGHRSQWVGENASLAAAGQAAAAIVASVGRSRQ